MTRIGAKYVKHMNDGFDSLAIYLGPLNYETIARIENDEMILSMRFLSGAINTTVGEGVSSHPVRK
jgi:hypothetical protein